MGHEFGLECREQLRGAGRLRVCREAGEKLLDLPDGLVFFSSAGIDLDEA